MSVSERKKVQAEKVIQTSCPCRQVQLCNPALLQEEGNNNHIGRGNSPYIRNGRDVGKGPNLCGKKRKEKKRKEKRNYVGRETLATSSKEKEIHRLDSPPAVLMLY
eukprot:523793-Pelagomonas_calceolata.AAC.1